MAKRSTDHEVYERIQEEHEELRNKLGEIRRVLAEENSTADEVVTLLTDFRDQLESHFYHEESDGFFEQITTQAPRLSGRADNLCLEHQQMLGVAMELINFAVGPASDAWWKELQIRFRVFSKQLMHHESEENQLLQQAYHEDIGDND